MRILGEALVKRNLAVKLLAVAMAAYLAGSNPFPLNASSHRSPAPTLTVPWMDPCRSPLTIPMHLLLPIPPAAPRASP